MKITQKLKIMLKSILSIQMGEVATDKAVLIFDGEELIAGMEVFVMGEENEPVPAADGDYTTEDGKVIKVVEGKVAEIVDPEAEVAEENPLRESFVKQKAQGEESYDEKTRKIAEAIRAKGFDAWVVEAADDYAVAEIWAEGVANKHYRFAISWDEEGNPIVGEMTEVEQEYVPVEGIAQTEVKQEANEEVAPADEPEEAAEEISIEDRVAQLESRFAAFVEGIDAVMNAIAEMENRIADLEAKMASVEAPAAEPIDEQPKVEETHQSRLSYLRKK